MYPKQIKTANLMLAFAIKYFINPAKFYKRTYFRKKCLASKTALYNSSDGPYRYYVTRPFHPGKDPGGAHALYMNDIAGIHAHLKPLLICKQKYLYYRIKSHQIDEVRKSLTK